MKRIVSNESDRISQWVAEQYRGSWTPYRFSAIGLEIDGKLVAGTSYEGFNGQSIMLHVAILPGIYLPRDYIFACFDYPFNQLGAKKLIGTVPASNEAALRFDLQLGFTPEATLKDVLPDGDLLLLTMTRDQCRWLKLGDRYGKQKRGQEP